MVRAVRTAFATNQALCNEAVAIFLPEGFQHPALRFEFSHLLETGHFRNYFLLTLFARRKRTSSKSEYRFPSLNCGLGEADSRVCHSNRYDFRSELAAPAYQLVEKGFSSCSGTVVRSKPVGTGKLGTFENSRQFRGRGELFYATKRENSGESGDTNDPTVQPSTERGSNRSLFDNHQVHDADTVPAP